MQSMESKVIDIILQIAEKWASGELAKLAATNTTVTAQTAAVVAGQTAQTTAVATGAAASAAASKAASATVIPGDAAKAAAGAYASASQVPYVGWILGPVAAAAAFAGVMAFGGQAAEGVWDVPQDMGVYVHQGETIVPTNFAQGLRSSGSLDGGGGGSGGGQITIAPNISVSAWDTQTGASALMDQAQTLTQIIAQEIRNNNPDLMQALRASGAIR
jgi:hypothetical protein